MENKLIQYLKQPCLPATLNAEHTITTLNQSLDRDGVYHEDSITIPATFRAVREFLAD